jgi:hypothetical protein
MSHSRLASACGPEVGNWFGDPLQRAVLESLEIDGPTPRRACHRAADQDLTRRCRISDAR